VIEVILTNNSITGDATDELFPALVFLTVSDPAVSNVVHDRHDQHKQKNGDQHSDNGGCKVSDNRMLHSVLGAIQIK